MNEFLSSLMGDKKRTLVEISLIVNESNAPQKERKEMLDKIRNGLKVGIDQNLIKSIVSFRDRNYRPNTFGFRNLTEKIENLK